MSMRKPLGGLLVASVIALTSCGKQPQAPPARVGGVDVSKLRQVFQDSPDEVHRSLDQVLVKIRYHQYPEAIAGLDQLTSEPSVTDPQKQALTNAIEQVKTAMATAPAPGGAQ